MLSALSLLIAFSLLGICFKIFALLFSAAFTVTGFFFKLAFGIVCAIVSAVLLFSVVGVLIIFFLVPACIAVVCLRNRVY